MEVVGPLGDTAWCTGRKGRKMSDLALVGPQREGAGLLTLLGAAREVITGRAATDSDRALDALAAVLAGDTAGIDEAFADLVPRTPWLPEPLRPKEGRP